MGLHIEMRATDTDMDMDEPTGPVGVQFRGPELRPRHVNSGNRNGPLVTHTSIVRF
jgi:hypothetical protein